MDNKTILELAQRKKRKNSEYENSVGLRGGAWSTVAALFIMSLLFFVELSVKGTYNVGILAVGCTLTGIDALYEGCKTRKFFLIIIGASLLIFDLICILVFLWQVLCV